MDESSSSPAPIAPLNINLSELDMAPSWVVRGQEVGSGSVTWGISEENRRRGAGGPRFDRGDRGDRRDFRDQRSGPPRGDRQGGQNRGPRPAGGGFSGPPRGQGRPEGGFREGGRPPRFERGDRGDRRDFRGPREEPREFFAPPPPGWSVDLLPEGQGVETLAVQIRATGRAYAVFDLARLFLSHRERYRLRFSARSNAQPPVLTMCAADGSLWLSRDEAKRHFSDASLLSQFFKEEKIAVDPPKGVFATVAVCGMSGTVLGPPNFHTYQRNLVQLHQAKFKNMPFERFKSRVRIERDEEKVKQWIESQSSQTHYTLLDGGENPPVFKSVDEAVRYLFETKESELLVETTSAVVPGTVPARQLSPALFNLLRQTMEEQRRFPMQLVQELCRQFEGHGLRFFKEQKKETYVSRSRPRPLDPGYQVSERVKAIIAFIREHPKCTYQDVVVGLVPDAQALVQKPEAPKRKDKRGERRREPLNPKILSEEAAPHETGPAENVAEAVEPLTPATESAESSATVETGVPQPENGAAAAPAPVSETEVSAPEAVAEGSAEIPAGESAPNAEVVPVSKESAAPAEEPAESVAPSASEASVEPAETEEATAEPTAADREGIAVLQDLRWLIREGHVTEFANGQLRVVERHDRPPQEPAAPRQPKPKREGRPPRAPRDPADPAVPGGPETATGHVPLVSGGDQTAPDAETEPSSDANVATGSESASETAPLEAVVEEVPSTDAPVPVVEVPASGGGNEGPSAIDEGVVVVAAEAVPTEPAPTDAKSEPTDAESR